MEYSNLFVAVMMSLGYVAVIASLGCVMLNFSCIYYFIFQDHDLPDFAARAIHLSNFICSPPCLSICLSDARR